MTFLAAVAAVAAAGLIAGALHDLLTDRGAHAAPRHLGRPVAEDLSERVIPRHPTRSQPPAHLFPPLGELVLIDTPDPDWPQPGTERMVWSGGADTGRWERIDLEQLLEGIAA